MDSMIIFVLVNVVLAFVVGVMGNMATPKIQSFLKTNSFSRRQQRIEALAKMYLEAKLLKDNPDRLKDYYQNILAQGLIQVTIMMFVAGTNVMLTIKNPSSSIVLSLFGTVVWGASACLNFLLMSLVSKRMLTFDKFKEDTFNKLKKLGVSSKDLERLDEEFKETEEKKEEIVETPKKKQHKR